MGGSPHSFLCSNHRSSYRSYRRSASTAVCIPSSTCYPCSTSICSALVLPLFSPLHPPLFLYSFLNLCRRYSRRSRSRSPSLYCTNLALPFFISQFAVHRFVYHAQCGPWFVTYSACSSLLSIQSWPSSIPPAPSTALPTALSAALHQPLSVYLPQRVILAPPHCAHWHYYYWHCGHHTRYVHRSPFTVLVISDSPSLMYLLAISRFLLCRFYSQRSRVGFRSLLPLLGQLQLNVLYICLTMDHRISFSLK